MSLSKREFLTFGVAGAAAAALPARAQPKALFETINMFVPAAPGGGWDGTARAIERAAKAAGLVAPTTNMVSSWLPQERAASTMWR